MTLNLLLQLMPLMMTTACLPKAVNANNLQLTQSYFCKESESEQEGHHCWNPVL
jgi:hypothetical protein